MAIFLFSEVNLTSPRTKSDARHKVQFASADALSRGYHKDSLEGRNSSGRTCFVNITSS